jgi:transcriptional regulator with XRE-family HTH domain
MLAENIKKHRKDAAMTQAELAMAAGLTQAYISRLESGTNENPPTKTLTRIAAALRTSVANLLGEAISA